MTDRTHVLSDLGGRLAEVERQRLTRENRRLVQQIDELSEELARVREMHALQSQLLTRERNMRAEIIGKLRALFAELPVRKAASTMLAQPLPTEEIPAFLRSSAVSDEETVRSWSTVRSLIARLGGRAVALASTRA